MLTDFDSFTNTIKPYLNFDEKIKKFFYSGWKTLISFSENVPTFEFSNTTKIRYEQLMPYIHYCSHGCESD